MDVEPKPTLAQRIDDILQDAMGDVIAEAREAGWREGYSQGRMEVRREMNKWLRALILEEDADPIDCSGMHAVLDEAFGPEEPATSEGDAGEDAGQSESEASAPPELPETAAAVPAAAPSGPGAEQGLNQPPPPPQELPAAEPPAPPAVLPASKPVWPADWRTDDRKRKFIELYEIGDDMTEIRLTLAEMPGPRMPEKNAPLWAWVTALKIKRIVAAEPQQPAVAPPRERPIASPPAIAPTAPRTDGTNPKAAAVQLPPPRENGKVYTSFPNIRAWAGIYNIAYDGSNIDKVNKLRAAKGLPPLVQEA